MQEKDKDNKDAVWREYKANSVVKGQVGVICHIIIGVVSVD
jgi:hypothetical protein